MATIRAFFFAVLVFVGLSISANAQAPITATANATLLSDMPRRVSFTLSANSTAGTITEARIYYQPVGSSARISEPVTFDPAASVELEHEWSPQTNGIPPGAQTEYFWRLKDSAGNQFDTPKQYYVPLDPRYNWQTIEDDELSVSWYDGNQAWGQAMFDTGKDAIATLEAELQTDLTRQVRLVAYGREQDFRGAFPPQQDWIGGQAFPDLGVTVQIIGSNDTWWMQTVLHHELSHLVFAQATEGALQRPPSWMDEGLAMYNEPGEGRNSKDTVQRAAEDNELLPFSRIQGNFGADGRTVGIAYAQSEMMVTYLLDNCGSDGFQQIVANLVADMTLDEAMTDACGYDAQTLFTNWRATLPNAPKPNTDTTGNPNSQNPDTGTDQPTQDDGVSIEVQGTGTGAQDQGQRLRSLFSALAVVGLCMMVVFGSAIVFVVFRLLQPGSRRT